jgi:chromosome segregation ATPase
MSDASFHRMKAQKDLYLAKTEPHMCPTCGEEKSRVILCSACYKSLCEQLAKVEAERDALKRDLCCIKQDMHSPTKERDELRTIRDTLQGEVERLRELIRETGPAEDDIEDDTEEPSDA